MTAFKKSQSHIRLCQPTSGLLEAIRSLLPFGIVTFNCPHDGGHYGLVVQCGQSELVAVKQQPPDCDAHQVGSLSQSNAMLVAHGLSAYLAQGFAGLFMPCPYRFEKEGGRFEAGLAYFGYPMAAHHESQDMLFQSVYDKQLGCGFTRMLTSFIGTLRSSAQAAGITLQPTLSLSTQSCGKLGALDLGFMVVGPQVVCLKTHVDEQDPIWSVLYDSGIHEVHHLPAVPLIVRDNPSHMLNLRQHGFQPAQEPRRQPYRPERTGP